MSTGKGVDSARGAAHARISSGLWPISAVFALAFAAAALFWPTTESLLAEWRNAETLTYTHGYLVALISAWLLFRERQALEAAAGRVDYRAALGLAALSILWLIAHRAGLQLVHQVLLPVIAWFAAWAALGWAAARRCAFALAFLYFAIPVWSQGNFILQDATVVAVKLLLELTGVTAHVVGNVVHITAGVFEIVGGCSGLHFFIVAIALATLYGELSRDPPKVRLALVALAALVAIVSNWLRVYAIIVAGHLTDMQHFIVKVDHYYFGWFVFALAMALFFAIARRLPSNPPPPASAKSLAREPANYAGVAVALAAMAVGPAWSLGQRAAADGVGIASTPLPVDPGSWQGPSTAPAAWQPRYVGADAELRGQYRRSGRVASVYVATYEEQRQGKELIGYDNSLIAGSGELIASRRAAQASIPLTELEVNDAEQGASLIWYYYEIGSRRFARDLAAQLSYGTASLVTSPASHLVALRTDCRPDCAAARAALSDLLGALDDARQTAEESP